MDGVTPGAGADDVRGRRKPGQVARHKPEGGRAHNQVGRLLSLCLAHSGERASALASYAGLCHRPSQPHIHVRTRLRTAPLP